MVKLNGVSRAAVFSAPGAPVRIEQVSLPRPSGREVVARIRCATICGSDLHSFFGRRETPAPSVLGHEMVGEVLRIGPEGAHDFDGQSLSVGDRITWSMIWSCGECFYCSRGLHPKCERLMKFGHERVQPGRELSGGFAEHCFLPEGTAIFRVPDSLTDAVASPANCAAATVAAVFRHAGSVEGQTVAVVGTGMLGITACAMASSNGARSVIAIDRDAARSALAPSFGATAVLDGSAPPEELRRMVLDATSGRGADLVMEFSGASEAAEASVELLGFGGRCLLAGATFPARPIQLSAEQIVRRLLHISGVYNYQPQDLSTALKFLAGNCARFPFHTLVERAFPLDQLEAAMLHAERARPFRVAILPFDSEMGDILRRDY